MIDYKNPTDKLNPAAPLDKTKMAKDNIGRLSDAMRGGESVHEAVVGDKNGRPLTMRTENGSHADFQKTLQNDSTRFPQHAARIRMENESGQEIGLANVTMEVKKGFNNETGRYDQFIDNRMRLNDIIVPKSERGNGIGSQMLDRAEELARDSQAREIYGMLEREESRQFFADRGYQFRGTNKRELYKTYYSESWALTDGTKGEFLKPDAAQIEAGHIIGEWGDAFPGGLEADRLSEALQNYDVSTVEGIVSTGCGWEDSAYRTEWVHDRLDKLNQTADIPGMDSIAEHLTDNFSANKQKGAEFELDWVSAHADQVQSVGMVTADRSDDSLRNIKEGIDVQMKDGSYVELKSYDFSRPYYQKGAGVDGPLRQLERDVKERGAKDITVVFDASWGAMPPAFKRRLDNGIERLLDKHPDATINCNTWRRES